MDLQVTKTYVNKSKGQNCQNNSIWRKPYQERIKAKCDANLQDEGSRELGAVIKYFQGQVLIVATWKMEGFACPQTAEASVLLKTTK